MFLGVETACFKMPTCSETKVTEGDHTFEESCAAAGGLLYFLF